MKVQATFQQTAFLFLLSFFTLNAGASNPTEAWARPDLGDTRVYSFRFDRKANDNITHEFDVQFVLFRNAGWTIEHVRDGVRKTNQIFGQCGLRIGSARLIETTHFSDSLLDFTLLGYDSKKNTYEVHGEIETLDHYQMLEKPVIYLVRRMTNRAGYARHRGNGCINPLRCDTIWISSVVHADPYKTLYHPDFHIFAHELGHVLMDDPTHADDKTHNLMSAYMDRNRPVLGPAQCERIKQSPLVRRIH